MMMILTEAEELLWLQSESEWSEEESVGARSQRRGGGSVGWAPFNFSQLKLCLMKIFYWDKDSDLKKHLHNRWCPSSEDEVLTYTAEKVLKVLMVVEPCSCD